MIIRINRFIVYIYLKLNFLATLFANDDSKFEINWKGDHLKFETEMKNFELLDYKTNHMEKYRCLIPILTKIENEQEDSIKSKIQVSSLLDEIYEKKFCSYRIESYWIYELCHGQHIKQYHETKNTGKRTVTESYFLGKYKPENQEKNYLEINSQIQWRILDGKSIPAYAVKYSDGTKCEVMPNLMRETTVLYACSENGNENIATFEEISSCIYEMIVVSKSICSHPAYKQKERVQNSINCFSVDGSPIKPLNQIDIENEFNALKSEDNTIKMTDREGSTFILHYQNTEDRASDMLVKPESELTMPDVAKQNNFIQKPLSNKLNTKKKEEQKKMIISFLNGEECLTGGNGWWKFEICYGKYVMQFHEDDNTKVRTSILLGTWNPENHLDWLQRNGKKRPLANIEERKISSLFYSNGQTCEGTNKKRSVEIKFKCTQRTESSHAISLYLLEPQICEYLLVIESSWLCNFIKQTDMNGIPKSVENIAEDFID